MKTRILYSLALLLFVAAPALAQINSVDLNDIFEGTNAVVARNEIDNTAGRYFFAAALLAPNEFNGDITILEIDWESSSDRSRVIPTAIKNRPSNKPLNGSMSASS